MATVNATKWGYMRSISSATFSTVRSSNGFTVVNSPTNIVSSVEYVASSGRGSLTHALRRAYFTFDVSSITGTVSSLSLNFRTSTTAGVGFRVVKSTAFGGSNSNLATSEFANIDTSTPYSNSITGAASNPFSMTLNSDAESDVQSNSYFICAVIENDHDFTATAATSAYNKAMQINWALTPYLEFTEAAASGPANLTSLNSIAKASITSFNTTTIANISSINSVS
mgnify:CR=1 FL=1|tara:strand:+ start:222 stop:899 length:678 start_codon:yes stop_codon:yes gene_type:complete